MAGEDDRALWYPAVEFITGAQFNEWTALIEHAADRFARKSD
jgi:hypothetical protein